MSITTKIYYVLNRHRVVTCCSAHLEDFRTSDSERLMEPKASKLPVVKRKKRSVGGGILSALQRALWRREKSAKTTAVSAPSSPPSVSRPVAAAVTLESLFGDAVFALSIPDTPTAEATSTTVTLDQPSNVAQPPKPIDDEDEYEDDEDVDEENTTGQTSKKNNNRKASRWVPKLLVPADKMRNKIHTKKRRVKRQTNTTDHPRAPDLLTVINAQHLELLATIMSFLGGSEPARGCALVNRALAAGARAYYELYCAQPRPTAFLVGRVLLKQPKSRYLLQILLYLTMKDRVQASGTCSVFRKCCDAQPLEFSSECRTQKFMTVLGCDPTRVETRYGSTRTLRISMLYICTEVWNEFCVESWHLIGNATSTSTSSIITLMDTGDIECFSNVRDLIISKVRGFGRKNGPGHDFERTMQVLFTDHVSTRLETLVLNGLFGTY